MPMAFTEQALQSNPASAKNKIRFKHCVKHEPRRRLIISFLGYLLSLFDVNTFRKTI